jgi:hypothetical protein
VAITSFESHNFPKILPLFRPHLGMTDTRSEQADLASLNQLVHEIIGGVARRHTFSQWELELLLDLQTCGIRKSSRPEVLRRYLRAVHNHFAQGALTPLKLSTFLDAENQRSRSSEEKRAEKKAELKAQAAQ